MRVVESLGRELETKTNCIFFYAVTQCITHTGPSIFTTTSCVKLAPPLAWTLQQPPPWALGIPLTLLKCTLCSSSLSGLLRLQI